MSGDRWSNRCVADCMAMPRYIVISFSPESEGGSSDTCAFDTREEAEAEYQNALAAYGGDCDVGLFVLERGRWTATVKRREFYPPLEGDG